MSEVSVSIETATDPLVIADDGTLFRIAEDGLGRPGVTWRLGQAPDSPDIHGSETISAARDTTNLPLKILITAATYAELEEALDELDAALSQFIYETTVTIKGVSRIWTCDPGSYTSTIDSGQANASIATVSITIPVQPISTLVPPEES